MARALKVCSVPGCPTLIPAGTSRCPGCRQQADRQRGTAHQRGYGTEHRDLFRTKVIERDPVCVECKQRPSVHADHHPLSRRELVARGLNPNDPKHGRGLCHQCHSRETAQHQPGGFNAR